MLTRHNAIDLVVSSEREAEIKYIMHPFYHYIDLLKSVLDGRSGMIVTKGSTKNQILPCPSKCIRTERECVGLFFKSSRNILAQCRLARCFL